MWFNLGVEKSCSKCNKHFTITEDDQSFYLKMGVPVPEVCPECRFMMRSLFRNETTLYSGRKCALCDKSIVTMYNPKSPYTIYCYDCFNSEKWDPKDYATDYDESRSFIEQMKEFLIKVPKINLYLTLGYGENVNSPYVNMASGCKNCYLVFNTGPAEETLYSRGLRKSSDSSDLYFGFSTDRCYESINIQESASVTHGQNVVGCVDSHFLLNCSNLTNCFGCVNLRNKSNCFFNEQLTAEEYKEKVGEILGSYQKMEEMKNKFDEFTIDFPRRANNNFKTVDSTGDYISECKNVKESFEIFQSEDCKYLFASKIIKDSYDVLGYGTNCQMLLNCVATGFSNNIIGTYSAENSSNILYGFYVDNCHDCVGCDALKHGKYAIFNKEYTKEEYERLRAKIVQELTDAGLYGLMMPPELAPFAYNETVAQDNIPLTKEEAIGRGFRWEDDIQITKGKETLQPDQIADNIKDIDGSITDEVLRCAKCERNYKITEQELLFYKKMNLPIPRQCFYCRHNARVVRRGPFKLFTRPCSNCGLDTYTNLTEGVAPTIYCESCYQKEVI